MSESSQLLICFVLCHVQITQTEVTDGAEEFSMCQSVQYHKEKIKQTIFSFQAINLRVTRIINENCYRRPLILISKNALSYRLAGRRKYLVNFRLELSQNSLQIFSSPQDYLQSYKLVDQTNSSDFPILNEYYTFTYVYVWHS